MTVLYAPGSPDGSVHVRHTTLFPISIPKHGIIRPAISGVKILKYARALLFAGYSPPLITAAPVVCMREREPHNLCDDQSTHEVGTRSAVGRI